MASVGIAIATGVLKKMLFECFNIAQEVWGHPDKFKKLLALIDSVHDTSKDLEEMATTERITFDKTLDNSLEELNQSIKGSSDKLTELKKKGFLKRLKSYKDIRKEMKGIIVDVETKHKSLQFTMGAATYVAVKKLQATFQECFEKLTIRLDNIDNQLRSVLEDSKQEPDDDVEDVRTDFGGVAVKHSKLACPLLEPEVKLLEKYIAISIQEEQKNLADTFDKVKDSLMNVPMCPSQDEEGVLLPSEESLEKVSEELNSAILLLREITNSKENDMLINLLIELEGSV